MATWSIWNNTITATDLISSAITFDEWTAWNTTGTSTSGTTGTIWFSWSDDVTATFHPVFAHEQESIIAHERAERQRLFEAHDAHMREQRRIADAAHARAESLLRSCLNREQAEQYGRQKHFIVHGRSGARYRVRPGRTGNVDVIGRDGFISHRLCFHPRDDCPEPDVMLAQKLMLEDDDNGAVGIANRHAAFDARREQVLGALQ